MGRETSPSLFSYNKVKVLVTQSCLTLCDPMNCSPPGSSVYGILKAKILEGLPFLSPGDLPTQGSNLGLPHCRQILYCLSHQIQFSSVAQSCPTLCDPMDYRPPSSSVHGILQAKILEWVAIPFFRRSFRQKLKMGLLHCRQILYHLSHQRSPF